MGTVVDMHARKIPDSKECRACCRVLPAAEFSPFLRNRDGLHAYCKPCNSDRVNAYNKRRLSGDWAERLLSYVRSAYANKKRVKVRTWSASDITKDFLWELLRAQSGRCHWTGIALSLDSGKPWSISLDRLNCGGGYTRDNVVLCCKAANLARSDSSPDEMRAFIEMIRRS